MRRVVESLIEWLAAPEQTSLRRMFTVWLGRVLLPARLPGIHVPAVDDLKEVRSMLAERVIEWTKDWKQQGIELGRQEGRQEGLSGMRDNILTVLEVRFGETPLFIRERLQQTDDLAQLKQLHRQAILAASLDEFIRKLSLEGADRCEN